MLIAIMTIASPVSAQTIVKGHVVNERGETVEYVSIGFAEGESQSLSVGTISDAKGNFELEIPANRKKAWFGDNFPCAQHVKWKGHGGTCQECHAISDQIPGGLYVCLFGGSGVLAVWQ